jgi:phosphatidylserine/phosphatidylglycerophosphate/cardiolipin synthase-like enzyme
VFGLDFGLLAQNGADVRLANQKNGTMHNKFCVIDDKVITGSYNWTYHANLNNENIVVIDESDIVNGFCIQFDNLFNTSIPIDLPYEHLCIIRPIPVQFPEVLQGTGEA